MGILFDTYKNSLYNTLIKTQDSNKLYENLQNHLKNYNKEYKTISQDIEIYKDFIKSLKEQKQIYTEENISDLEETVQTALDYIEPDKGYKVIIKYTHYRNKNGLVLMLIDKRGNEVPPHILEGDMLNQVLSFTASTILAKKAGCKTVYYDECFGSANSRSLINIKKILESFSSLDMNFVLVSQNPILLTGLNRHRIELVQRNGQIDEVVETDISGEDVKENEETLLNLLDELENI